MTNSRPSSAQGSLYRFLQEGTEVEEREFLGDDAAEEHARELSKAKQVPITIERRDHVDWEYVTEADERP
ncbi:MAG TPA: hypothetical protein VED59_04035 [Acidimicrobiales bacterium]|nr:hypothetical protein [Acidimicrobiales bacterium]